MRDKIIYIRKKLLHWYKDNGRGFLWRHTRDPYKIMIAEFMLHRTKAEQVVPVYQDFINKYPDIKSLVSAEENKIKKVTEHLGLHWRSQHFINAAKFIIEEYNGVFPDDSKSLQKIPGFGSYITGAILIICFNKRYPVVDANVARFFNRFFGLNLKGEIRRKKEIIRIADAYFNCREKAKLLFATIDLCHYICKTHKPECINCPIENRCHFKNQGRKSYL